MTEDAAEAEEVDCFVSYTGVDEQWALWISRVLEETGYRVRVQARDFGSGLFPIAMEEAVRAAHHLVPVLSEAYLKSKYGLQEWAAFAGTPEAIIPVKIQDIATRSLMGPLVRVNIVNRDEAAAEAHIREQMAALAGPPSEPPRTWDGPPAPFPDPPQLVAPDREEPGGERAPERILPDPDAVQLVLFGDRAERLRGFARHVGTGTSRTLDLVGSSLSADGQLAAVGDALAEPGREDVTDVLVVFAGAATADPIDGTRLRLGIGDDKILPLGDLFTLLRKCARNRRVYLLLDAVDANDASVLPPTTPQVPILDLRKPSGTGEAVGLAGLDDVLAGRRDELSKRLRHAAALTLGDLAVLSGGTLLTAEGWTGAQVGLLRSPLGWPSTTPDELPHWCVVLSSADAARADNAVADATRLVGYWENTKLSREFAEAGRTVELEKEVPGIAAADVFASPASFADAVARVCAADIVIFDITDYEPAVIVLLGIRAAVRRGISLCVHTPHADPWRGVPEPFHLREISMLTALTRKSIFRRLRAGIQQLAYPEHGYTDLPSFEPLRSVPIEPARRGNRPLRNVADPVVLALVPFDVKYAETNWEHLEENLPLEARPHLQSEETVLRVQRTLDLESPRVLSAQLYEAIRLTDFCLVDLTLNRPNVLFELGVRLAANPLHPVVILNPPKADQDISPSPAVRQRDQLAAILAAIEYEPSVTDLPSLGRMVDRHIELVNIDNNPESSPRERTVLNGFPPRGVFDLAWRFAAIADETVTMSVAARLEAVADGVLPNSNAGAVQLLYPPQHPLHRVAARSGREHLIAAWLYQHFREGGPLHPDAAERKRYEELSEKLLEQLSLAPNEDDDTFAAQVKQWMADVQERGDQQPPAMQAQPSSVREQHDKALEAVAQSKATYEQAVAGGDSESVAKAAKALADRWGRLGGVLRRSERLDEALAAYRNGAEIETDYGLADTYNRTNVITLEVLLDARRLPALEHIISKTLAAVQAQTEGPRREEPWAFADLGLLNLLASREQAARAAYLNFIRNGPEPAFVASTLDVLRKLRAAVAAIGDVAGFDEAIRIVEGRT